MSRCRFPAKGAIAAAFPPPAADVSGSPRASPARVDASVVDNGESGLTPARARAAQPTGTEPANRPGSGADQTEHDEKS
jgi:hypothetical protein